MTQELLNHKVKCRLCFQRISGTRNTTTVTETVQQKFFRLTNVELKSSENFSNCICKSCINSLNDSCEFQQKMIDNQLRLYSFEGEANKQIVKEEPPELKTIQLQEITFADLLPKTEVFDGSWIGEQSPELEDFAEVESPASPDNNGTATPPNEAVEHDCREDSDERPAPSRIKQKKRSRVNYKPEQLFNAVEAVALGELSTRAASKQFGVPASTVLRRFNADHSLLTDQEELQVKLFVNRRTEAGIPSTDDDITKFILFRLLSKRRGKDRVKIKSLSSTWVSMFRKRHSDMNVLENQAGIELICDICGFSLCDMRNLRIHMKLHAQTENLKKPPKSRFKLSSDAFKKAMKLVAGGMSERKAAKLHGIPETTFHRRRKKEAKEKSGLEPEISKCSFCEKCFYSKSSRRSHEVMNHLTPDGEFPCEVCGRVYPSQVKLKMHNYSSHVKVQVECTECSEVFEDRNKLRYHQHTIHNVEVACHVCGKMVKEGTKMKKHMENHKPSDTYKCSFEGCTKTFHCKSSFNYHKNTHLKQNIKCPKCSATFPNATRLKSHDERSHGEARFFCMVDGCSYKNTRKEYLKLHLKNHKDIDVFMREELIASLRHLEAKK